MRVIMMAISLLLVAHTAVAQSTNALMCHIVKDSFKQIDGAVNIVNPNLPFVATHCTWVRSKVKLHCVSSDVELLGSFSRYGVPMMQLGNIAGSEVANDYLRYKVKCYGYTPEMPPQLMEDMLGTRLISRYKHSIYCLPAINRYVTPTTTTTSTTLP